MGLFLSSKKKQKVKDEKGNHACFPMTEDFEKTKESWLTLGKMYGTYTTEDYDAELFKFE